MYPRRYGVVDSKRNVLEGVDAGRKKDPHKWRTWHLVVGSIAAVVIGMAVAYGVTGPSSGSPAHSQDGANAPRHPLSMPPPTTPTTAAPPLAAGGGTVPEFAGTSSGTPGFGAGAGGGTGGGGSQLASGSPPVTPAPVVPPAILPEAPDPVYLVAAGIAGGTGAVVLLLRRRRRAELVVGAPAEPGM